MENDFISFSFCVLAHLNVRGNQILKFLNIYGSICHSCFEHYELWVVTEKQSGHNVMKSKTVLFKCRIFLSFDP